MKKRYWILLFILVIIFGWFLFNKQTHKQSQQTYKVTRQDISDELLLAGVVDAERRVDLGFATSGRIKRVIAHEGDKVRKGSVIAQIEQNRLSADLTQARANLSLVRSDTVSDTDSARDNLEKQRTQQDKLVRHAYQEYLSGDLEAYNLKKTPAIAPTISGTYLGDEEGEYILEFYKSSTISGYSFRLSGLESGRYSADSSKPTKLGERGLYIQIDPKESYRGTRWVVAIPNPRSATYLSRKNAYENAKSNRDTLLSELENRVKRLTSSRAGISRSKALTRQAEAQVTAIAAQLGDGKIRAPFSGVVVKNKLEVGETISALTPVITLLENTTKKLTVKVPEIYINKIEKGDEVRVVLDVYPEESFKGTITHIDMIDTEVDGVPVYETDIVLGSDDERIRIGMNAKARIVADKRTKVLAVPKHYLTKNKDKKDIVFVQNEEGDDIREQIVELGFIGNNGLVEIQSGLSEGDTIILKEK